MTRTVLAGEQLSDADFKVVSISSDDSFPCGAGVGSRAAGRPVRQGAAGAGLAGGDRQRADPSRWSTRTKVLMSVPVPLSGVPTGLREGSRLVLIVTPPSAGAGPATPVLVEATVAAVPRNLGELVAGSGDRRRRLDGGVVGRGAAGVGGIGRVGRGGRGGGVGSGGAVPVDASRRRARSRDADGSVPAAPVERWPTAVSVAVVDELARARRRRRRAVAAVGGVDAGRSAGGVRRVRPVGGDVAAWAELRETPGWSTAVAAGDRSWAGLRTHLQQMPSGLQRVGGPDAGRAGAGGGAGGGDPVRADAAVAVGRDHVSPTAAGWATEVPAWAAPAYAGAAAGPPGADVGGGDGGAGGPGGVRRWSVLGRRSTRRVGVVVVGRPPVSAGAAGRACRRRAVRGVAGGSDRRGLAAGAWTVGRGAARSPLARAARPLAARLVDARVRSRVRWSRWIATPAGRWRDDPCSRRAVEPVDPTAGELSPEERRGCWCAASPTRSGRGCRRKVQEALEAGRPMTEDGGEGGVVDGDPAGVALGERGPAAAGTGRRSSEATHGRCTTSVLAHVYGLGELEELWNHPEVENIDANGPFDVFVTFVGGPQEAVAADRRRPTRSSST